MLGPCPLSHFHTNRQQIGMEIAASYVTCGAGLVLQSDMLRDEAGLRLSVDCPFSHPLV